MKWHSMELSLTSLGWCVVLASVALAWLGFARNQRRKQKASQSQLRELEAIRDFQEREIQQLTASIERMQEAEAGMRAIIDNALDGIISIDKRGQIVAFNPAAEAMFGFQRGEVLGRQLVDCIVPPALGERHSRGLAHFLQTGEGPWVGRRIETIGLRADGREFPIEMAITVVHPGRSSLLTAHLRDITARKRVEEELRQTRDAAESSNRAKSAFLANVSHEIRTPMNGILGMTQLALETELTEEQREYLQMVKTSADGLLVVINDILDFSKIEAGKLELDPVEFELRDVVTDALRSLSLRASAKNLELACQIPAEVPDYVVGDPDRLRQILVNLVGNAIKFTERGEVVVRARLVEDGERGAPALQPRGEIALHFAVADTGIGIDPEKLPYIFDPFVQADSSTTRKHGGTGLGLTITGRLVEMMNGRLWAESVPGQGSTFHFTLRLQLQDRSPSRLLPRRPLDLQGLAVLVVDDNATNRRIMEELLTSWQMKPTTADGARSALAELEAVSAAGTPFPLVLLDAHMPEQDGFELAAAIQARPHLEAPALMMLSSANRIGDGERCRRLGIGQRLSKPIKPSDLLDAILRLMEPESLAPPPSPAPPRFVQAPSNGAMVAVVDGEADRGPAAVRSLRVLLAEDNLVNRRLVLAVLEKLGHRTVAVADGAAAVRALRQETFDLVLMDVQMPEMNGLEATRAIRADEQHRGGHVPIVAMTAHALTGDRQECLRAGMDDYLSKPIQVPSLVRVLDEWTGTPREKAAGDARLIAFDPRPLLQRIGEDWELFRELVSMFQEDGPRLLRDVRAAVEAGDGAAVQSAAHLLKGTASNFAAAEVVRAAQQLEDMGHRGDLTESDAAFRRLEESLTAFLAALDKWLAVHPAGSAT